MLTRKQMEEFWRSKLICATHFNWWGAKWVKDYDGDNEYHQIGWCKKPWDAHHATGGEDPANETK